MRVSRRVRLRAVLCAFGTALRHCRSGGDTRRVGCAAARRDWVVTCPHTSEADSRAQQAPVPTLHRRARRVHRCVVWLPGLRGAGGAQESALCPNEPCCVASVPASARAPIRLLQTGCAERRCGQASRAWWVPALPRAVCGDALRRVGTEAGPLGQPGRQDDMDDTTLSPDGTREVRTGCRGAGARSRERGRRREPLQRVLCRRHGTHGTVLCRQHGTLLCR